jgi:hypothetical protein
MATLHDFIEVTSISAFTTYSTANGNLLGVIDNVTGSSLDDGEFDIGDMIQIGGVAYRIDAIREPDSNGTFTLGDGTIRTFVSGSESNLDVVFLTVSSGASVRYFIVPNDRFGDMNIQAITTGQLKDVAGSDAAIISTTNNQLNVVCFTRGAMISVPAGQRAVEDLQVGDLVLTADRGPRPIVWIGSRHLKRDDLVLHERLRPISIAAGAFGFALPTAPTAFSPQHRVLVRSRIAERMFGVAEVLVAVRQLLPLPGIEVALPCSKPEGVEYFHILLDRHEIVAANGLPCESLYPGTRALDGIAPSSREEVLALLSRLAFDESVPVPARKLLCGREGRKLAERHVRNSKPLLDMPTPPLRSRTK